MTKKGETLLREAPALDESERVELAGALLESLEPAADADLEQAWRDEVERRIHEAVSSA